MATVLIPAPLRKYTNNTAQCKIDADNITNMIKEMNKRFPELQKHLINVDGQIPQFINIFVDSNDIRSMKNGQTEITANHTISIVPAIAGG